MTKEECKSCDYFQPDIEKGLMCSLTDVNIIMMHKCPYVNKEEK